MTGIVGAVFSFGFNFAPSGWHLCDGSLLPIAQYEALYSLIGTTFGGNGQTTFGVPNLQGRVPVGTGQGPGLSNYVLGQAAGNETVTLLASNLPSHSHPVLSATLPVSGNNGDLPDPAGNYFGVSDSNIGLTYNNAGGATMAPTISQSGITGSGLPIEILNPYQTVNYCICLFGIYPQRN